MNTSFNSRTIFRDNNISRRRREENIRSLFLINIPRSIKTPQRCVRDSQNNYFVHFYFENKAINKLTLTKAHNLSYCRGQPPTWVNPAALTDFSSHYLFFNLITDDTSGSFGRGAVAIVTECKSAMLTSYGTWPFKVFILLYTWPGDHRGHAVNMM